MRSVYALFILYILFPKVDLLPMNGAAVRITDLIFIIALFLYLQVKGLRVPSIPIVNNYLLFCAFAFLSLALNQGLLNVFGLLNVLRLVQYVFWAYVGYEAARYRTPYQFARDMQFVTAFLFVWVALEALHLIPKIGKFSDVENRVSGNTSGPFEIAVISAFLLFVTRRKLTKGLALIILLLSQARSTIIITLLIILKPYWRLTIPFVALAIPFTVFVPWNSIVQQTRFVTLPTMSDVYASAVWYWQHTSPMSLGEVNMQRQQTVLVSHASEVESSNVKDWSFQVRVWRWSIMLKSLLSSREALFFGFGPGIWGTGVDGYFIRLLGEYGLIGTAIYCWMLISAFRDRTLDRTFKEYLWCLVVTALFIDIFVTDKPMTLFWFYAGLSTGTTVLVSDAGRDCAEAHNGEAPTFAQPQPI